MQLLCVALYYLLCIAHLSLWRGEGEKKEGWKAREWKGGGKGELNGERNSGIACQAVFIEGTAPLGQKILS